MAVKAIQKDILEVLYTSKTYMKTQDIFLKLKKYNITMRSFQKEMKILLDTNRIVSDGYASSIQYTYNLIQKTYSSNKFLYVYKNNTLLGLFFKLDTIYRFYYDNEYLFKYNEPIPSLELRVEYYDFENIPSVFEENLPEGINREIFEVTHQEADEFDILSILTDTIGDLCFSESLEKCYSDDAFKDNYSEVINEVLSLNPSLNFLGDYEIDMSKEELYPENYDLSILTNKITDGISGFQYKKLINIDFENKKISVNEKSHEYILKPFSPLKSNKESVYYFPHIALNEHLFMSFAKNELGFRVPYSAIVKLNYNGRKENNDLEEYHYIVKRFDRNGINRFAKSTFAVFLGLRSENKYDTTSEKMFKRIAQEIISPKERMELLKHYAYSVIIVHEDMHTKNLSLIFSKGKRLFAPLYDICCTGCYDSIKGHESKLTINGKQNNIAINDFKGLCKILEIDFKEFKEMAQKIAQIYKEKLPFYLDEFQSLEFTKFYHKKYKTHRGEREPILKIVGEEVSFIELLREFHLKRVESLKQFGWLVG